VFFVIFQFLDSPDLQEQCTYRRLQLTQSNPASTASRANMPYLDLSLSDVAMSTARPSLCMVFPARSTHPSITRNRTFGHKFITLMASVFSFSLHLYETGQTNYCSVHNTPAGPTVVVASNLPRGFTYGYGLRRRNVHHVQSV